MKKKCLVLAVAAALVLSMAGCGEAKKYEKDAELVLDIADFDWDDPEEMLDDLDEYKFVTKEGKEIKEAFEDVFEALIDEDEDEIDELWEETIELFVKFYDAAEEAGVDEDLLNDLEDEFDLDSYEKSGGTVKKYEKDIDSFLEVVDLDFYDVDDLDELDEVKEEFGELEFVTDEGIEFQKTFEDLLDLYEEALELDEAYNDDEIDYDEYEEEIEKFEEESEELGEEMRDLLEDFYDAAEETKEVSLTSWNTWHSTELQTFLE